MRETQRGITAMPLLWFVLLITLYNLITHSADIPKMPYLEAFIRESMRYKMVLPMALPHRLTADVSFLIVFVFCICLGLCVLVCVKGCVFFFQRFLLFAL